MNNQEQIGEDGSSQEQIRVKRSTTIQVYIRENSRQGYFGECIGDYRSRQEQVGVYRIKWQQLGVDRSRYNYIRLYRSRQEKLGVYRSRQEKLGVLGVAWSTRSSQEQLGLDRNKREYIKVDRSRQKWIRVNIIIKEQLEVDKSMSMQEQIKSIYEYQGEARSS